MRCDVATFDGHELLPNIERAFWARKDKPWPRKIPGVLDALLHMERSLTLRRSAGQTVAALGTQIDLSALLIHSGLILARVLDVPAYVRDWALAGEAYLQDAIADLSQRSDDAVATCYLGEASHNLALSIIPLALSACAGAGRESKVAPACNETIGLAARLSDLKVGEQRVQFSVFPQQATIGEAPHGPDPQLRVRFFRVIEQSPELTQPGQELRLYTPELPPVAHSKLAPLPTQFGVAQDVHGYEASVAFDKPGAWGAKYLFEPPGRLRLP